VLFIAVIIADRTSAQSPALGRPFERSSILKLPPSSTQTYTARTRSQFLSRLQNICSA